jgi:putative hydrolase of the HAD superfamily
VLLDALGTLVELEPPAPRLQAALAGRGVEVTVAQAGRAMAAEIGYYRAHLGEGRDPESLEQLRGRCADVLVAALPPVARDLAGDEAVAVLLESVRFRAFPEVPSALAALRAHGARLVVVSNWDASLHDVLATPGLAPALDGVIASAELGLAKPDPAPFRAGLERAGVAPEHAVHVGDSLEEDVAGARAAGIEPVLLAREAVEGTPPGIRVIAALDELAGAAP